MGPNYYLQLSETKHSHPVLNFFINKMFLGICETYTEKDILNMFLNICYKDYFFLIKNWFVLKKNP